MMSYSVSQQQPPRTLSAHSGHALFGEGETMCYYSLEVIRGWFINSTADFRGLTETE